MALNPIIDLVKQRLPYLASGDDVSIASWTLEMFYFLQPQTHKTDSEVEVEANYKPLECMLFADLVAYNMLQKKIMQNIAGVNGSEVTPASTLTKAVADVVEAEFAPIKASDGTVLLMDSKGLLTELKLSICSRAMQLRYYIPIICGDPVYDQIPAFKIVGIN